ncbi:hypothetical protein SAMN05421788_110103 [Filimonas lacunae]|uniref:Uncharacterized protein n=1 Tax=Filimonas lacunae TaxID=477680 RepID=A0A1N7R7T8_9BACT|nr:hypothetical protein [Filimonas lacunae]SIT31200.1 hypothetical protein SAMN05421788_110103 [Filimonas lacunae]
MIEARKIHLIEQMLKVNDDAALTRLESILQELTRIHSTPRPFSAHELSGVWNKEDADLIEKAIEEGCEQINEDDWK